MHKNKRNVPINEESNQEEHESKNTNGDITDITTDKLSKVNNLLEKITKGLNQGVDLHEITQELKQHHSSESVSEK